MLRNNLYLYIDGKPVKVSDEVYREFMHYERKERYFMEDLKAERMVIDQKTQSVKVIPSREDSYERLLEKEQQFEATDELAEDIVIKRILLEKLETALHTLDDQELKLIQEIFYLEKTERDIAALLQISQNTVNYRKNKVLAKLRKLIEK